MRNLKVKTMMIAGTLTIVTPAIQAQKSTEDGLFIPSLKVGLLMHTYVGLQQKGYGQNTETPSARRWDTEATLYRARIMTEAKLSGKDQIFLETELTSSVGASGDKAASIKILDAQYDHVFAKELTVSAGKILVSHNRNGLQTASTLMANDFTYFQYPYNMSSESPLQNDLGRDIGVNLSGGLGDQSLQYRLGGFAGRQDFEKSSRSPLRVVGRVQYNFMDVDQYSGTNLGQGKTLTLAGGFDTQGTYYAAGADLYMDLPAGEWGSVTLNTAWSYLSGGNDPDKKYSFATLIPAQNVTFAELGYYFRFCRLQPWVRFERQDVNARTNQRAELSKSDFDKLHSSTVFGGGLNYFFNGYTTNIRLSYVAMNKGVEQATGGIKNKTYGQLWLQLQLCSF